MAQTVKDLPAVWETWVQPLVRKILWRRERLSTLVFLLGEFHGQRSLVGYSPCGHKELDTTKGLKTRDLFKKIRDTKGTFHAKMGSIKDRNGMD